MFLKITPAAGDDGKANKSIKTLIIPQADIISVSLHENGCRKVIWEENEKFHCFNVVEEFEELEKHLCPEP